MKTSDLIKELNIEKERRAEIRKAVDKILDMKDEKDRLRQAFNLWLSVNPKIEVSYSDGSKAWVTAKVAYKQTLEKIRFLKEQQERDDGRRFSATRSDDAGWRSLMEFPPGSIEFMRMFAMDLFAADQKEQKRATIKLGRVFPELVTPRGGVES